MMLFIASEHKSGETKGTGPLGSIGEAERMMDRIAKVKDVVSAKCYRVNEQGESQGEPLMTYTKEGADA